jgi:subtilisin family serine protease
MSLGITVEIDSRNYKRYVKNSEKFAELLNKHPDVLFVAAAGNDGRWVDGVARKTFPCGVENVKNMLCVGSLSKDFNFSTFSNLPVNHVPTVFTLGEDVLSTMPTNYCPEIDSYALGKVLSSENQTEAYHQEELTKLVDRINKNCVENRIDFKFLSGTSMATPLISRVAANLLIESPQLNAAQVINSVLDKAENYFDFKKLRLLKPSWYLNPDIINRVKKPSKYNQQKTGFEENFVKSDFPSPFFDFYIPKSSRL